MMKVDTDQVEDLTSGTTSSKIITSEYVPKIVKSATVKWNNNVEDPQYNYIEDFITEVTFTDGTTTSLPVNIVRIRQQSGIRSIIERGTQLTKKTSFLNAKSDKGCWVDLIAPAGIYDPDAKLYNILMPIP